MESSIKVQVDHNSNPNILISLIKTDDPRDQLIENMIQKLQCNSNWFYVHFGPIPDNNQAASKIMLTPIGGSLEELEVLQKEVKERIDLIKGLAQKVN